MSNFTIEAFWKRRLSTVRSAPANLVRGWSYERAGLDTFKEAPLVQSEEIGGDPERSSLLLVSAPGAVGKSTLARQIAFLTGAVYIDLANADPVGGNTLSGGLLRSNVH
jgi:hypothetical protein